MSFPESRYMPREHLFCVLAKRPVWVTFNVLSSGRSPSRSESEFLQCDVLWDVPILLSQPLSSFKFTFRAIPPAAHLKALERWQHLHSHSCLFFYNSNYIPFIFHATSIFIVFCFFAALPSLLPNFLFQLPFFCFCFLTKV